MRPLPQTAMEAIAANHWRVHVSHGYRNSTEMYKWLQPAGKDLQIHTVAVRVSCRRGDGFVPMDPSRGRRLAEVFGEDPRDPAYRVLRPERVPMPRGIVVKEVVRASVDSRQIYIKDLAQGHMCGYQVDWSPERQSRPRAWSYNGKWEAEDWSPRGAWMLCRQTINPEILRQHPRFKWCAWTEECGDIVKWLKTYVAHPRIELLAKAGIGWFGTRTGFVKQLERNKQLGRFVMDNLEKIRKGNGYDVNEIRKAFKHGITLEQARHTIELRRMASNCRVPREVDAARAIAYANDKRNKTYLRQYGDYLRDCQALGLDLKDTKVAFPRQFHRRRRLVAEQREAIRRRKDAEEAKKHDAQIAAAAAKYARLEGGTGAFRLLLPRSNADVVRIGKQLEICLGAPHYAAMYSERMVAGDGVLAFVQRTDKRGAAVAAVEWSRTRNKVVQCYGAKNARPPAPVVRFVNRVFARAGACKASKVA